MVDGAPERLREAREALAAAGEPFDQERVEAGPARAGRAARGEAEGGLPADPGGDHRHDGLAGDLRVGRRARPRGDRSPASTPLSSTPA